MALSEQEVSLWQYITLNSAFLVVLCRTQYDQTSVVQLIVRYNIYRRM